MKFSRHLVELTIQQFGSLECRHYHFQFHVIARIGDSTQAIKDHICVHDQFENALKTRLNWSKSIEDKRDAPWQIVLGNSTRMNPIFCVHQFGVVA
jgi:hypothetical protein